MANDLGPNEELIGLPGSRRRLMTPALVLDLDAFERNLAAMAGLCREAGLALRPHGKTHKCTTIARRQIEAGAVGVCCATLREAAAMVAADVPGVHISSPVVDPRKIDRLIALNRSARRLSVVSDNPANAEDLEAAARQAGQRLDIVVDVDIGLGRTGTATVEDAMALVACVRRSDVLRFAGIQAYSGRVQHIEAYYARAEVYGAQLDRLVQMLDALKRADIVPPIVTGGGTGTFGIDRERKTVTEHQAGSYIFMDVEYGRVQLLPDRMSPFATALTMMCTVVSANAAGFVTIDGGFKCFATDGPLPELSSGVPPGARYERFGDEHGKLVFGQSNDRLAIGAKVELVTPHCDPTVNLHDYYHCVRGDTLVDIWPIDARGSL